MGPDPPDRERWRRVDDLVAQALRLGPDERRAYLDRACAGDDDLRREVDSLLAGEADAGGFLDPERSPIAAAAAIELDVERAWAQAFVGTRFDGFALEEPIGEGGMGTVFAAWQERPGRRAAVKILHEGLARPEDVRRFEYEAQVLGSLRHPSIAHLYASGMVRHPTSPREELPYFAMELVPGARSITRYAREERLSPEERMRLLLEVCEGVQHAHRSGVLHRDLKPTNLIVGEDGRPRVIDFGLARPLVPDERTYSLKGFLVGTLQYMSPEQCGAAPEASDLRTDVYSLGVVLYELATGQRPYDVRDRSIYEALRVIREEPPRAPSRVDPRCRGDLEVVLLKALAKEPEDRYPTVAALAEDLRRVLEREPILARPPSLARRVVLFARRDPLAAVACVAALAALVVGGAVSALLAVGQARALREVGRRQRVSEEVIRFLDEDLLSPLDPYRGTDPDLRVRDALDAAARRVDGRFPGEPLVEGGVRRSIGAAYVALGAPVLGIEHLRRAEALLAAEPGPDDLDLLLVRRDLARALVAVGELAQGERMARDVLVGLEGREGVDLMRASLLGLRADAARARGDFAAAIEGFRGARALRIEVDGEDDLDALILGASLAETYREAGDLARAESLGQEVLERSRALFGDEHPRTLSSVAQLALVRLDLGHTEEAAQHFADCLAIAERVAGEENDLTLNLRFNLATACASLGRTDEAAAQIERAREGYLRAVGPDHLDTLAATSVLGRVRLQQGRAEEAAELFADAHARLREHFGAGHRTTKEVALHRSRAILATEGRPAAIEFLEAVVAELDPQEGPNEPALALLNTVATLQLGEGRNAEARPTLERVAQQMHVLFGVHIGTAVSLRNLGRCLRALGDDAGAEAALDESLACSRELFGDGHALTVEVRGMLVELLRSQGRTEEAADLAVLD